MNFVNHMGMKLVDDNNPCYAAKKKGKEKVRQPVVRCRRYGIEIAENGKAENTDRDSGSDDMSCLEFSPAFKIDRSSNRNDNVGCNEPECCYRSDPAVNIEVTRALQ